MSTFQIIDEKPGYANNNKDNSERSKVALQVASILQRAAMQSINLSTTGIHNHLDDHSKAKCKTVALNLLTYVGNALPCPGTATSRSVDAEFMMNPLNYAKSMVMLARDMDAQPWGAFAFHAPSVYMPFLGQLASDLMD